MGFSCHSEKPVIRQYKQNMATLCRGLAGCHGETIEGSSVTYYDSRMRAYFGELVNGGFVIDNRAALDRSPSLAIKSPMCKGSLLPGGRDNFRDASGSIVSHALASEPDNGYCGLARLMLAAPKCGAFDFVAPDVYAAWWAEHGARVGERNGDYILWNDGTEEKILPAERRFLDCGDD